MTPRSFGFLVAVASLTAAASAHARPFRPDQVPNGSDVGCILCHSSTGGGDARNLFGLDVEATLVGDTTADASVDWAAIFDQDSDGDGYTNGVELGDPDGAWVPGEDPAFALSSLPGQADDTPCGDGRLNGPEACDGDQLGDATCDTLGQGEGTLACDATCQYDTSGCSGGGGPVCGDGTANTDAGEQCDGNDLAGADCRSRGFDRGTLVCTEGCTFDTSGCVGSADPICGNGVREGDEACDGTELGGATCWILGYGGGDLTCTGSCTLDESGCTPEEPWGDVGGVPGDAGLVDAGGGGTDGGGGAGDAGGGGSDAPKDEGGCSAASRSAPFGSLVWMALAVALARRRVYGCNHTNESMTRRAI